jgi:hypothetical protein
MRVPIYTQHQTLPRTGGMASSVYGFFDGLIEKYFTFQNQNENLLYEAPPGHKDLHILTFNDAEGCVKEIQSELRFDKNVTQALRHFGSISLSPGRKIPVPGCEKREVDLTPTDFIIESKVATPSFNEYVVQSSILTNTGTSRYKYYTWFVGGNASGSEDASAFVPPGKHNGFR